MKDKILNLKINGSIDYKFGLITRHIERIEEDMFEIHDTSDKWLTAQVNKQQMTDILDNKLKLPQLNWK